jgi:hypothetical protein
VGPNPRPPSIRSHPVSSKSRWFSAPATKFLNDINQKQSAMPARTGPQAARVTPTAAAQGAPTAGCAQPDINSGRSLGRRGANRMCPQYEFDYIGRLLWRF